MVKTLKALILLLLLLLVQPVMAADFEDYYSGDVRPETSNIAPQKVTLNADRVSFNDETGHALAEGNAVLKYDGTTIMAERIEYDADTQKVKAMPLPGEKVVLTNGNRSIKGDQIDYDLNSGEGILEGPSTHLSVGENGESLYVYGGEINVLPWGLAQERGLVKGTPQEYMVQWRPRSSTLQARNKEYYFHSQQKGHSEKAPCLSRQHLSFHFTDGLRRPAQAQVIGLLGATVHSEN